MKVVDIIFALICGRFIGFLVGDFLREWGIPIDLYYSLVIWLVFPFFTLFCLWLAHKAGKKFLFMYQGSKFLLVGAVATIIDLKLFEVLAFASTFIFLINPLIIKGISFLVATLIKFWGNKYWTFLKHEKEELHKEALQFFIVTCIGLTIDVVAFYGFSVLLGPQFNFSPAIWLKLSVIFAALVAALWNFLGYKHFVFKK